MLIIYLYSHITANILHKLQDNNSTVPFSVLFGQRHLTIMSTSRNYIHSVFLFVQRHPVEDAYRIILTSTPSCWWDLGSRSKHVSRNSFHYCHTFSLIAELYLLTLSIFTLLVHSPTCTDVSVSHLTLPMCKAVYRRAQPFCQSSSLTDVQSRSRTCTGVNNQQ